MEARRDGTIVIDEIGGRIVRIVGEHRRIPDEKRRPVLLAVIDEGLDRLEGLPANRQAIVAVAIAAGHPSREPPARKIPLPPLAGLEGTVAVRGEEGWERRPFGEVPVHRLAALLEETLPLGRVPCEPVAAGGIVADDPVLVGEAAGDQRGQARATEARRDIPAPVKKAFARQPVEVGRPQVGMAHEGVVAPVLVVGDYCNDIRPGPASGRFGRSGTIPVGCHAAPHSAEQGQEGHERPADPWPRGRPTTGKQRLEVRERHGQAPPSEGMHSRHQRPISPLPPYRTHGRGRDPILPRPRTPHGLVPRAARDIFRNAP